MRKDWLKAFIVSELKKTPLLTNYSYREGYKQALELILAKTMGGVFDSLPDAISSSKNNVSMAQ